MIAIISVLSVKLATFTQETAYAVKVIWDVVVIAVRQVTLDIRIASAVTVTGMVPKLPTQMAQFNATTLANVPAKRW